LVFLESRGVMRPSLQPDPVRRLSALLPADKDAAAAVAVRLRLSNADSDRLCRLAAPDAWPDRRQPAADQRRMIYRLGADAFRDLTLLAWAAARASEGYGPSGDSDRWMALLDLADSWTAPNFPLTGTDALALGIKPGPRIGQILRQLETDWQDRDFIPDRAALLEKLATLSRLPPPA
jgi:poly(A) polymerase